MEQFTEEHAQRLMGTEWMAKTDAGTSTPYLFKFNFSAVDLTCVIMVTDTKKVWSEVVNDKLFARRWRSCNSQSPEPFPDPLAEEAWRECNLELLTAAHTIGGVADSSFELVDSKYSDLCLNLEWETFKWRWEHLLLPLISLNHLTFSAAEVISEMSDTDVEKTLDKLGRTARRTTDTHIKNALSKPRLATSINRMTALFNFLPDLPRVTSIAEKPLLEVKEVEDRANNHDSTTKAKGRYTASPKPAGEPILQMYEQKPVPQAVNPEDSLTESDNDEQAINPGLSRAATAGPLKTVSSVQLQHPPQLQASPPPASTEAKPSSDSDSVQRPIKKMKASVPDSSDDDGDNALKKPGALGTGPKRGTRQPVKRGGKRF